MSTQRDQAIVIRLVDFSEASQVVAMFTAGAGQVRLIAKGIRRGTKQRVAVGLDLLELGDLAYAPARGDATLGTLTDWRQRDTFPGLRGELVRTYAGLFAAEAVATLTEAGDPHPALFDTMLAFLRTLDDRASPVTADRAILRFCAALLTAIGYMPELARCASCNRPRPRGSPAWFSPAAGGLLCRDCEMNYAHKRRLSAAMLDGGPEHADASAWLALYLDHLSFIAGRPLRTAATLAHELKRCSRPAGL